ncbi:hypothetical protein OEZ86_011083 [Tetradesmus obliquus]|nr:hypothetical protein OEZ86_011083 [Tetradesmus obliquus]
MRIQQRNLLGPAAFAKGTVQPKSASPPPILLDGALLLASCPGAEQPADVLFVDLNSVGLCCPSGLSCLRLLDVSFNLIPAEQLLGVTSPLARLPRNAIMGLQHQQLVAAFERVEQGIGSWQLAPVAEEGSEAWDDDGDEEEQQQQQQQGQQHGQGQQTGAAAGIAEAGEPVVDQTFLTGVGITDELPGDDEEAADAGQQAADDSFQDPTERLAIALGLQVCQLAHYTHRQPGNPLAAIHRLRHALAHPLVDADAGMQPPQHHTGMTAAALAKQRPRQLLPLPQPIPAALDTRVKAVQGIEAVLTSMRGRLQVLEGTLLQQLQAQSDKLSAVAQAMSHNAAECGEDSVAHADQPTTDMAQTGCAED